MEDVPISVMEHPGWLFGAEYKIDRTRLELHQDKSSFLIK
jgi:hypothetical protein